MNKRRTDNARLSVYTEILKSTHVELIGKYTYTLKARECITVLTMVGGPRHGHVVNTIVTAV
jgi:hypothetical protein